MAKFKLIVQEITEASSVNLDVWELKLTVEEVKIYKIKLEWRSNRTGCRK
jgi:hypothetical protein